MKGFVKVFLGVLLTVALAVFAVKLVKEKKQEIRSRPTPKLRAKALEVVPVKKGLLEVTETYVATLEPVLKAKVSTKISGFVLRVTKREGDPVKRGELLVEVEAEELKRRLQAARIQLASAEEELNFRKRVFERNLTLVRHEVISQEAFESSELALKLAKKKVERLREEVLSLKETLKYATLKAPFDGVVTRVFVKEGDLARPGAPLLELESPKRGYKVLISVPQEKVLSVREGTLVYLKGGEAEVKVRISRVYPSVDQRRLAVAEVLLKENPFGLPSGAVLEARVVTKVVRGWILPLKAIVPQRNSAFKVVEKTLKEVKLTVLGQSGESVACRGEFEEGDLVVVADPGVLLNLYEGQKVIPIPGRRQ